MTSKTKKSALVVPDLPPNAGTNLISMLLNAAQGSVEDLRGRVSNVRDAPLAIAIEKNCECIHFEFDGQTHLGELRGRNRDLCIDRSNPESEVNKAIAVRVLLDRNAIKETSIDLNKESAKNAGYTVHPANDADEFSEEDIPSSSLSTPRG